MKNDEFAHITDCHLDEKFVHELGVDTRVNWTTLLNDIKSKGIKKIVFGGDIGEVSAHKWFFDSIKDFDYYISPGNHDSAQLLNQFYKPQNKISNGVLYTAWEDKFNKYLIMDSSTEEISDSQFEWFIAEAKTTKTINLFVHHPILGIEAVIDKRFYLVGRDRIRDALLKTSTKVNIFSGHYHMEASIQHTNINQYITPASSYQVVKHPTEIILNADKFGYRIINFLAMKTNTSVIRFNS